MAQLTVVTVTLEDRVDGGLRVYSDNLPGLILSGPNAEDVAESIIPAIEGLFDFMGQRVSVRAAKPICDFLREPSPRDVNMHVNHHAQAKTQQFVVEFAEAA